MQLPHGRKQQGLNESNKVNQNDIKSNIDQIQEKTFKHKWKVKISANQD